MAQQLQEDSAEKKRLAEERERKAEEAGGGSSLLDSLAARPKKRETMVIPDKAPSLPPPTAPSSASEAAPFAPPPSTDQAPVKVAAWAAAKSGINQQKAALAALDTSNYIDPAKVCAFIFISILLPSHISDDTMLPFLFSNLQLFQPLHFYHSTFRYIKLQNKPYL